MMQVLNESLSVLIAFILGVIAYRSMSTSYKLFFVQLSVWILVYISAYVITKYQKWNHIDHDNHWIYNINILIEGSILSAGVYYFFESNKAKKRLVLILYSLFCLLYFIAIYTWGAISFNHYALILESLTLTTLFVMVLYQIVINKPNWIMSPLFWISLGLLIYFACNIPYFSFFNYLNENHPKVSEQLFSVITDILANIRYGFLAIGFWLIIRKKNTVESPHE